MKRILYLLSILFSLESAAVVPDGAIRFIFDGHLYLQSKLNNDIPVTLVYDTGADFLYLDEDWLKLNNHKDLFGRKVKAMIGGAGNGGDVPVDVFIDPVNIHLGMLEYRNKLTPIIKLRDILGRHADGLVGNTHLLTAPLEINFSKSYMYQLKEPLSADLLADYIKLDARFEDNRIDVKARLQIDERNALEGWFRMDLGSGSSIILTNEAASSLSLTETPKAYFSTQAGGIGGGSDEVTLRAAEFSMADTLENLVIDYSLNEKGALSSGRPYIGLIGNEIWSLYDIVLDQANSSVWVRRNEREGTYAQASVTHMASIDRTDICDGWIVNGLYKGGIAEEAGIEIGDIIIAINNRPVKEITWDEQRKGLNLKGETVYTVRKKNGTTVSYTLFIDKQII